MKPPLLFINLCVATLATFAQNLAGIRVSYEYTRPARTGKNITTKMSLLASAAGAKYFNETSQWADSLQSTPDGKRKYYEIMRKSCIVEKPDGTQTLDLNKGPAKVVYTYVFVSPTEDILTHYDEFGEENCYYTEPLGEMGWTMTEDSTATVLGYECIMAESDYHGRHWKAWFAPEIPLPFGPWKLHGLPGLILKAEANGGFSFVATGIEHTDTEIPPMYFADDYSKVDRKKALENAEYFFNNMESIMSAEGGGKVTVYAVDDEGNRYELPEYDGRKHNLEPDYKK